MESIRASFRGEAQGAFCLIPIAALMALFTFVNWWLGRVGRLPEESYEQPVIFVEWIHYVFGSGWLLAPGAAIIGLLVSRHRALGCRWSELHRGQALRLIICVTAAVLAWSYSTYSYNYYFNQPHVIDRVLLIVLLVAITGRPFFVLPFLVVLLPVVGQMEHPLHGFSWAVPSLPVHILVLFSALLLLGLVTRSWSSDHFVFGLCCLLASHYWPSGLGKIQQGWLMRDQLYLLFPASYANGWLAFLPPADVERITRMLAAADFPLKVVTLLLECGALFFLYRRVSMMALLVGWMLFHLGVFALSGIFFWSWIVVEGTMLFVLWRSESFVPARMFSTWHFLASLVLIASSPIWLRPVALSWFDTGMSYSYRFEAVSDDGESFWLTSHFFSPNDYEFSLSKFGYLCRRRSLSVTSGVTVDPQLAERLFRAVNAEQILALETELGRRKFDEHRADALDEFLQRFVSNYNKLGTSQRLIDQLRAPAMLWTFPRENAFRGEQQIDRVNVYQVLSWFGDKKYREIRTRKIRSVQIPPSSAKE